MSAILTRLTSACETAIACPLLLANDTALFLPMGWGMNIRGIDMLFIGESIAAAANMVASWAKTARRSGLSGMLLPAVLHQLEGLTNRWGICETLTAGMFGSSA